MRLHALSTLLSFYTISFFIPCADRGAVYTHTFVPHTLSLFKHTPLFLHDLFFIPCADRGAMYIYTFVPHTLSFFKHTHSLFTQSLFSIPCATQRSRLPGPSSTYTHHFLSIHFLFKHTSIFPHNIFFSYLVLNGGAGHQAPLLLHTHAFYPHTLFVKCINCCCVGALWQCCSERKDKGNNIIIIET